MPWSKYVPGFVYHLCDLAHWLNEQLTGTPELRGGLVLLKNIFERDIRAALKLIAEILGGKPSRQNLLPMAAYLAATRDEMDMQEFTQQVARYAPKLKGEVMETYAETMMKRGRSNEALSYTLRLLTRRFGDLSAQVQAKIRKLTVEQLEQLGEDLLDFKQTSDLTNWLRTQKEPT